jgi:uncharacterized membrane protein YciS (DUF1049 family)
MSSLNLVNLMNYLKLLNNNDEIKGTTTTASSTSSRPLLAELFAGNSTTLETAASNNYSATTSKSSGSGSVSGGILFSDSNEIASSLTSAYVTSTTTSDLKTNEKVVFRDNHLLNVYTIIIVAIVACVLISGMAMAVVIYRIRVNYLLQRQINQLKRIDQQLGLEHDYTASGAGAWTCINL